MFNLYPQMLGCESDGFMTLSRFQIPTTSSGVEFNSRGPRGGWSLPWYWSLDLSLGLCSHLTCCLDVQHQKGRSRYQFLNSTRNPLDWSVLFQLKTQTGAYPTGNSPPHLEELSSTQSCGRSPTLKRKWFHRRAWIKERNFLLSERKGWETKSV